VQRVEEICLGEAYCGICMGNKCIIGYTKAILRSIQENNRNINIDNPEDLNNAVIKNYDKDKVLEGLGEVLVFLRNNNDQAKETLGLNRIRRVFERLLFNESIDEFDDLGRYYKKIDSLNHKTAAKLLKRVEALQREYDHLKIS
jgi:hypothetical protein